AGRAAESRTTTSVDATAATVDAEAAPEAAEDARKSVVSEKEIERGVVRAPTDVRTERGGDRIHDDHPPAARDERRCTSDGEPGDAAAQRYARGDEPDQSECRQDEIGLQVFGEERETNEGAREDRPAEASILETADHCPRGGYEKEGQERVGVVEPEHEHDDRRERHHHGRDESRYRPERPAHRLEEDDDRCDAGELRRREDAE